MDLRRTALEIGLFETALNLEAAGGLPWQAGAAMPLPAPGVPRKVEAVVDWLLTFAKRKYLFLTPEIALIEAMARKAKIEDQRSLVAVLMVVASLLAGVFSAGPAAAAMMPVIAELCRGPLQAQAHWLAVAYAAAICAGSSLFMWSATAGFILSDKVNGAALEDGSGRKVCWGWREYFGYGVANYLIQISIALAVVLSAF